MLPINLLRTQVTDTANSGVDVAAQAILSVLTAEGIPGWQPVPGDPKGAVRSKASFVGLAAGDLSKPAVNLDVNLVSKDPDGTFLVVRFEETHDVDRDPDKVSELVRRTSEALKAAMPQQVWAAYDAGRDQLPGRIVEAPPLSTDAAASMFAAALLAAPRPPPSPIVEAERRDETPTISGMVGGLGVLKETVDFIDGVGRRSPGEPAIRDLVVAALAVARRLPVEKAFKDVPGLSAYDVFHYPSTVREDFEYPSFSALLFARKGEVRKYVQTFSIWPHGRRLWPPPPEDAVQVRRKAYFDGVPGDAYVVRARGLAMVFPHLLPAERRPFLTEMAEALERLADNPVAKAIGMLAVVDRARGGYGREGEKDPLDPESDRRRMEGLATRLIGSVKAVEDPLLRARIACEALHLLEPGAWTEAVGIGKDALREHAGTAENEVDDVALAQSVILTCQLASVYGNHPKHTLPSWGSLTMPGHLVGEARRGMTEAFRLAHRIGDPIRRAFVLMALSGYLVGSFVGRTYRTIAPDVPVLHPDGSCALLREAFSILDAMEASDPSLAGYRQVRDRVTFDLPDGVVSLDASRVAAVDGCHAWAAERADAWLGEAVVDAWPSLAPLRFPSYSAIPVLRKAMIPASDEKGLPVIDASRFMRSPVG